MKRFQKILVALDTRLDDHPIVEEAASIARHNGASLTLVDVAPELSWTARLTVEDHAHVHELIIKEKQQKLASLTDALNRQGLQAEAKVFHGQTSVEIIREVLRAGHDLVLRVAKGNDSLRPGVFGNTGVRLLRQCPCAVWLVTADAKPKLNHVMACVDTSSGSEIDNDLNASVYQFASSISRHHHSKLSVVHAWPLWNDQLICDEVKQRLENFLRQQSAVRDENTHLLKGQPVSAVPDFANRSGVDLVVMGTVARSGLAGFVMGNTSEQILDQLECSVLALKPHGFVCPVRLDA